MNPQYFGLLSDEICIDISVSEIHSPSPKQIYYYYEWIESMTQVTIHTFNILQI